MFKSATSYRKRRRESYNIDVKLVEIYEDLANENDDIRITAASELVSRFTPESQPSDELIEKTLTRLFRGLCSGRKAARIGFSIALTEILSQVFALSGRNASSELDTPKALRIWETTSDASGSGSGQELRDRCFGRVFGAEAIIKSSILFQPNASPENWTKILTLVLELAKKKPWLREECGWVIYRSVYDAAAQKADVKFAELALSLAHANDMARSPEGVALWLAVKDVYPDANFPSNCWKQNDPLNTREQAALSKAMRESSKDTDSNQGREQQGTKTPGSWNPKLHFAWDIILAKFYEESAKNGLAKDPRSKSSRMGFREFWIEVIDSGLFATSSSDERKYWGFLLFKKVLNEAPLVLASLTFTPNFMRCLMNQLSVDDRYLHDMAIKAANAIHLRASRDPDFAPPAIKGLLGPNGSANFDHLTKTKTVNKIVGEASPSALQPIVSLLERLVARPGSTDSQAATSSRQSLANLLLSIVKSRSANCDDFQEAIEGVLSVLLQFAYFKGTTNEPSEPQVTEKIQVTFRSTLSSSLNSIIGNCTNATQIVYSTVQNIRESMATGIFGDSIIELDDGIVESIDRGFNSLKKLSKNTEDPRKDEAVCAFTLLYSMTILQVFNGDTDAVSMLDELDFCYSKLWGKKKSDKEDQVDASNALVEILLTFASKPSQLFRRISEQVFGVFAPRITTDGLQSLISILDAKENLAGQQEMFDQQEDGNDDHHEDEDMIDADEVDEDEDGDEDSDKDPSSEEEESSEIEVEEDEDEDDAELEAFDAKLAEALGTHRADKDLEEASDSSSESGMDDDQMEAIDEQLVKVFKTRSQIMSKKKDKKDAKENMVNFKNRVLDFVEIYIKKCHASIVALDLILPLLRLARKSTTQQICQKSHGVMREYVKSCKGPAIPPLGDTDTEPVWELLQAIHKEATLSAPPAHAASCSLGSLLVVKVLVAHDKQNVLRVVDVYGETRKQQLLNTKCHVKPTFFTDWSNWCQTATTQLRN